MEFQEVKDLFTKMQNHPYMLAQKVGVYYPNWCNALGLFIKNIEMKLEDEKYQSDIADNEMAEIYQGSLMLPAIMLLEDEEESWEIYEAIGMLIQNYGLIFEKPELVELAGILQKLTLTKNSLQSIIIQTESVLLQTQATINNSSTPYKLSRRFINSILGGKEDDE